MQNVYAETLIAMNHRRIDSTTSPVSTCPVFAMIDLAPSKRRKSVK